MYRVALVYNAKQPFDLKVMSGVARYRHECGDFITYIEDDLQNYQKIPDLSSWHGDGIIANFDSPQIASAVLNTKLPVVGFGGWYGAFPKSSKIPYFLSDQKAIGYLAADHLLERGFQNFAYCGYGEASGALWSNERERAFVSRVAKHGYQCNVYRPQHKAGARWNMVLASIGKWLKALPKPVAIMAAHDRRARHVLEACLAYHIRVPEDVAVIGVDNDEVLCQLATPELTSIEQDARRIGYEAAALLDKLMAGKAPFRRRFVFKPIGVLTRRSTDSFAINDPLVARALTIIRERACSGLKVPDVATALAISRSSLEMRLKRTVGCTIHSAIRKVQLERARQMVAETNMVMKRVAAATGFRSVQHMTSVFGKAYGKSPAKYRKDLIR